MSGRRGSFDAYETTVMVNEGLSGQRNTVAHPFRTAIFAISPPAWPQDGLNVTASLRRERRNGVVKDD